MAKIAPSSIKYIVYANFEAEGAIEKPDVIGALFGQTEGLLGEDILHPVSHRRAVGARESCCLRLQQSPTPPCSGEGSK